MLKHIDCDDRCYLHIDHDDRCYSNIDHGTIHTLTMVLFTHWPWCYLIIDHGVIHTLTIALITTILQIKIVWILFLQKMGSYNVLLYDSRISYLFFYLFFCPVHPKLGAQLILIRGYITYKSIV